MYEYEYCMYVCKELTISITAIADYREQAEYIRWLKEVKKIVE